MSHSADSVRFGRIHADRLDFYAALDAAEALCARGRGGFIVTPNVDHVVLAEQNPALVAAYGAASLSLVDGKPLVWLSRLMGQPLPGKISGSDFVMPLMARAAARGHPVFLLGGAPGVGNRAARVMAKAHPRLRVAGVLAPPKGFEHDVLVDGALVGAIRAAHPAIVLVALGAPRQELWMHRHHEALAPAVLMGVGGTLDFIAGDVRRAPRWVSDAGLEWLFRLAQEPRRLAGRYLVRDGAFARIALRTLLAARRAGSVAPLAPGPGPAPAPPPPLPAPFDENARY